jgi:hypothetical protein
MVASRAIGPRDPIEKGPAATQPCYPLIKNLTIHITKINHLLEAEDECEKPARPESAPFNAAQSNFTSPQKTRHLPQR